MKVNAGSFDRFIEIWHNVEGVKDSFGESAKTATLFLKTFAHRIEPGGMSDDERDDTQQILTDTKFQWLIRYPHAQIKPTMWILYEGVRFEIVTHPVEIGRKQYLRLTTIQKDNV